MIQESPFRLPNSETLFQYNENIKQLKMENRLNSQQLNIHEKKTASTRSEFKHYKKFEGSQQQQESLEQQKKKGVFQKKDKLFINLAMEIVQERQKKNSRLQNEEKIKGTKQRKENNIEMIDQIKEMFLVTMSHGIIENEICKLKQSQMDKQAALEQSIKLIQEDTKYFENYDNIKKKEVDQQQMNAEEEIKKKKMFEADYKTKFNQLNSLNHDIDKNEDLKQVYLGHKNFLDKLTNKETLDKYEKDKQQKLEQIRQKNIELLVNEGMTKKQAEEKVNWMIQNDKLQEYSNVEADQEMFFNNPAQLENNFIKLEERSLFLIDKTQNLNIKYDEAEAIYNQKKQQYSEQIKNLEHQKKELQNQFDQINNKIKNYKIFDQNKQKDNFDQIINPITRQLQEIYFLFKDEIGNLGQLQEQDSIKLLENIENLLDKQVKSINQYSEQNENMVRSLKDQYEKQRQQKAKDEKEKEKQRLIDAKNQKNFEKSIQPVKKKFGRNDMKRSSPQTKEQKKIAVVVDLQELEDKKYFLESD